MLRLHPTLEEELLDVLSDYAELDDEGRGEVRALLCECAWRNTIHILGSTLSERSDKRVTTADLLAELQLADAVRITRLRAAGDDREPSVTYWVRVSLCALLHACAPLVLLL